MVLGQTFLFWGQRRKLLGQTRMVLGQTGMVLGQTGMVLGQTGMVLGQTGMVLGQTGMVLGQTRMVLVYHEASDGPGPRAPGPWRPKADLFFTPFPGLGTYLEMFLESVPSRIRS